MAEPVPLHVTIAAVEAELREAGWSFPPDAIAAVAEGREWYVPLAGKPRHHLYPHRRRPIAAAIDRANCA